MFYNARMRKLPLIIAFALGLTLGQFIDFSATKPVVKISRSKEQKLTNPLLDCELYTGDEPRVRSAKAKIEAYLTEMKGRYREVAVYYRDLNNGPWFGINERAAFAPVSLLKVPLMIAYLKLAETNPALLDKKIDYRGSQLVEQNLPVTEQLTKNTEYSVDYLLYQMIGKSDNAAFEALLKQIDSRELRKIHEELDIVYPNNQTPEDYINVKTYAGLFRIMYNATYLSRTMSEKALTYLLQSDFNLGIRAGLPKNLRSALKFGIKTDPVDQNGNQIHDCGIVYLPDNPYLLCIMTKGDNRDSLIEIIGETSRLVYQTLSQN